jgi:hypothetical protein
MTSLWLDLYKNTIVTMIIKGKGGRGIKDPRPPHFTAYAAAPDCLGEFASPAALTEAATQALDNDG